MVTTNLICVTQQFRIKFLNIVLFQYLEIQWGSKNRLVMYSNSDLQYGCQMFQYLNAI